MAAKAFYDDNDLMSAAYLSRDYDIVKKSIRSIEFSNSITHNGEVYGYICNTNIPLTSLFGFDCLVIRFAFSCIDNLHNTEQETILTTLCEMMQADLESRQAYVNIRIPSHIIDLIRAINATFGSTKMYMCGGTIEEVHCGSYSREWLEHPEVKLFFADQAYLTRNRGILINLAYDSFRNYQGQYHISPVTCNKAGDVYSNWISNSIESAEENSILIAEVEGEIAGYITVEWNDKTLDGLLSSVDSRFRQNNIYKSMISFLIDCAKKHNKSFISSTQFDNFIVQGVWASMGMKPYYSIYNIHYDCRLS